MPTETLSFGKGVVEVTIIDNILYMKILNIFTDEMAIAMTRYIDELIDRIPGDLIRVWDTSDLSPQHYQLSNECVKAIVMWSEQFKLRKPGSCAYFIAKEQLIYGVSRMYELQVSDKAMDVMVLDSVDELPEEILAKLPTKQRMKEFG